MANIACGNCAAVLPTRHVKEFLAYFADSLNGKNPTKKVLFGTDCANAEVMHNKHGMSLLKFDVECRWSVNHCMFDKHDPYESITYVQLREALEACEVRRLTILTWEPGVGFEESVTYDKDEGNDIHYEVRDMFSNPENLDLDDSETDECGNAA